MGRPQKPLRIGVPRVVENILDRSVFDLAPGVHHHHALRRLGHHSEIMSDEENRHAQVGLQPVDECQHLRLHRHIERGGRLVGNEKMRLTTEAPFAIMRNAGACHPKDCGGRPPPAL